MVFIKLIVLKIQKVNNLKMKILKAKIISRKENNYK